MGFPKWKYHASKAPQVIQSEEQEKEIGSEWKESPAEFGVIVYPSDEELKVNKHKSYREYMEGWVSKAEQAEAKTEVKEEEKPKKAKKPKAE